MITEKLITLLSGVKRMGKDRWIARCPAHDDKSPSLAIREVDGRILLHCFAGCTVNEIVHAIGLELSDLFPERIKLKGNKSLSRPFPAADILKTLNFEITFLVVCASDLAKGNKLETQDYNRLLLSASRFRAALQAGGLS